MTCARNPNVINKLHYLFCTAPFVNHLPTFGTVKSLSYAVFRDIGSGRVCPTRVECRLGTTLGRIVLEVVTMINQKRVYTHYSKHSKSDFYFWSPNLKLHILVCLFHRLKKSEVNETFNNCGQHQQLPSSLLSTTN